MRCVACGEVHWNLRLSSRGDAVQQCRICGEELQVDRRRAGGRFDRLTLERRHAARPGEGAGFGPSAAS